MISLSKPMIAHHSVTNGANYIARSPCDALLQVTVQLPQKRASDTGSTSPSETRRSFEIPSKLTWSNELTGSHGNLTTERRSPYFVRDPNDFRQGRSANVCTPAAKMMRVAEYVHVSPDQPTALSKTCWRGELRIKVVNTNISIHRNGLRQKSLAMGSLLQAKPAIATAITGKHKPLATSDSISMNHKWSVGEYTSA